MKFVFLVTIWTADAPPVVDVLGADLTGPECIAAMAAYEGPDSPSCEIDHGSKD